MRTHGNGRHKLERELTQTLMRAAGLLNNDDLTQCFIVAAQELADLALFNPDTPEIVRAYFGYKREMQRRSLIPDEALLDLANLEITPTGDLQRRGLGGAN